MVVQVAGAALGVPQNVASQQFPARGILLWGESQDYTAEAAVRAVVDPDATYIVNPANADQILTPNFLLPQSKQILQIFAEGFFAYSPVLVPTPLQVRFIGRPFDDFTLDPPVSTVVGSQGNFTIQPFDAPIELNPLEPLSALVEGAGVGDIVVGLIYSIVAKLDRIVQFGRTILDDKSLPGDGMIAWGFPGAPTWGALPPKGLAVNGIVMDGTDQGSLRIVAPSVTVPYVWTTFPVVPGPTFTLNDNTSGITIPPNRRVAFRIEGPGIGNTVFMGLNVSPNQGVVFSPWTYTGEGRTAGTQGWSDGVINFSGWYGVFDTQNLPTIKVFSHLAVTPEFTARVLLQ